MWAISSLIIIALLPVMLLMASLEDPSKDVEFEGVDR
jgi:hypothetical protein